MYSIVTTVNNTVLYHNIYKYQNIFVHLKLILINYNNNLKYFDKGTQLPCAIFQNWSSDKPYPHGIFLSQNPF